MPHKRAKILVREREKAQRATDLVPKISTEHEPIPKSVSRILDAEQIRREYRKKRERDSMNHSDKNGLQHKKRRLDVNSTEGGSRETSALKIRNGETVSQFNRRVENSMMPIIKSALQQSSAQARRVRREEAAQQTLKRGKQGNKATVPPVSSKKELDPPSPPTLEGGTVNPRGITKEFQEVSTGAPRRLNDIVQEPPVIKKFPRSGTKKEKNVVAPPAGLSMAQKAMMEEERDKAIRHYRELKARKLRESDGVKPDQ